MQRHDFVAPVTVSGLVAALWRVGRMRGCWPAGTDLVLGVNQPRTEASSIVWTGRVRGLADIVETDTHLSDRRRRIPRGGVGGARGSRARP